jgi:uncharacterized protein (TIGR02452 family)
MNRNHRVQLAAETLEFVAQGWYQTATGERIEIASAIDKCLEGTRLYTPPELELLGAPTHKKGRQTEFEIRNETTLSAAHRLVVEYGHADTLVLNFASAKNPGGGFLGGSQAQEESLARSSALYASLITQETYYQANRACGTCLYTDHMILSPDVPIFRGDDDNLLTKPYPVSILTAPAVNAGAVLKQEPAQYQQIENVMANRIGKVLAIAAERGYQHLILGAWGCGVFRNDPAMIARLFAKQLREEGPFVGQFRTVVFAILDNTSERRFIGPFEQLFSLQQRAIP